MKTLQFLVMQVIQYRAILESETLDIDFCPLMSCTETISFERRSAERSSNRGIVWVCNGATLDFDATNLVMC